LAASATGGCLAGLHLPTGAAPGLLLAIIWETGWCGEWACSGGWGAAGAPSAGARRQALRQQPPLYLDRRFPSRGARGSRSERAGRGRPRRGSRAPVQHDARHARRATPCCSATAQPQHRTLVSHHVPTFPRMQKRSALTAALSGAPAAAPQPTPKPAAPSQSSTVSPDAYAYPCLAFATEDGSPRISEDTVEEIAQDLGSITIVGSAPTSTSMGSTVLVRAGGARGRGAPLAHPRTCAAAPPRRAGPVRAPAATACRVASLPAWPRRRHARERSALGPIALRRAGGLPAQPLQAEGRQGGQPHLWHLARLLGSERRRPTGRRASARLLPGRPGRCAHHHCRHRPPTARPPPAHRLPTARPPPAHRPPPLPRRTTAACRAPCRPAWAATL
jgi:hypothetical protein